MNSFKIERRLAGHHVVITAEHVERLELYCLRIVADGRLWDVRQSDDVLADAGEILAEAFEELMEEMSAAEA